MRLVKGQADDSVPGFELEDDKGYNPNKEYARSKDSIAKGGESVDRQIKFPAAIHAAVMDIIGERKIPEIKTFDAAVRSALFHWMKSRNAMVYNDNEAIEHVLRQEADQARQDRHRLHMETNRRVNESYKENCALAVGSGEWIVAAQLVIDGYEMAERYPDPLGPEILREAKNLEMRLPAEVRPMLEAMKGESDIDASAFSHVRFWR